MPAHAEIRRPLTLDELVAWNDELAALVRAGLPLEEGLINLGSEYSGRLGRLVRQLGNRLADLMADRSLGFPPLWQALVVAGLRSGRLDAVLASLANSGRCLASLRQAFGLALLYPVIVVITAYAAWLLLVVHLAPIWADAFVDLTGSGDRVLDLLRRTDVDHEQDGRLVVAMATFGVGNSEWHRVVAGAADVSGERSVVFACRLGFPADSPRPERSPTRGVL